MSGVVIQFDALPVRPPLEIIEPQEAIFCPCDFRCDFEELVFADASNDGIKNDYSDFLFKKISASDTIEIQIVKDNIVLTTISDDSYGAFYDGFTSQPLYVGWQADWTKIFQSFSGGQYTIRVTTNILGNESVFTSRLFRLNTFDVLSANRTIKIESFQNGQIANNEFDFTDLLEGGWPSSIRLQGTFGEAQFNLERDIYQDPSYREVQNRDEMIREFTARTEIVPESIVNRLGVKDVLGNQILITAYDVLQEQKYEKFPVVVEAFSDVRYDKLGRTFFDITLSDRQKNIIKTNV